MREEVFEAMQPVCPRCLHHEGKTSRLRIASRTEERAGHVWHGTLSCSDAACWLEFPIIDGIPLIVTDPRSTVTGQQANIMWRVDLPDETRGVLGDCFGASDVYQTIRYHLSLYGADHYAGWGLPGESGVAALLAWGVEALEARAPLAGPCLDLGGSVGRGGWELARRAGSPTIVGDLNLSMLRFGQQLAVDGAITLDLRRVGIVYDPVTLEVPSDQAGNAPDFWAIDAAALPFSTEQFGLVTGINLVDCTAAPTNVLSELLRVLKHGGGAMLATPHDWSPQATEMEYWLGGHSQRQPNQGAPEPALIETLKHLGLDEIVEDPDLTWRLRLHARSTMEYSTHAVAGRKPEGPFGGGPH